MQQNTGCKSQKQGNVNIEMPLKTQKMAHQNSKKGGKNRQTNTFVIFANYSSTICAENNSGDTLYYFLCSNIFVLFFFFL